MGPQVTVHYFESLSTGKRCRSDRIKGLELRTPYSKQTIRTWDKTVLKVSHRFLQDDAPKIGRYEDRSGRGYLFLGLSVVKAATTIAAWAGIRELRLMPHAFIAMHRKLTTRRSNGEVPVTAENLSSMFQTLNERAKGTLEICATRTGMTTANLRVDDLYDATDAAIEVLGLDIKCSSIRLPSIATTVLGKEKLKGMVAGTLHSIFCHLERVLDYAENGPADRLEGSTHSERIWDAIEKSADEGSLFSYIKGLTVLSLLAPIVDASGAPGDQLFEKGDDDEWVAADRLVAYMEDWHSE